MKAQVILFALVACLATHSGAEPSCPPSGDTETVVYFPHPTDCSKFLTCHWGNLVELSCPSGTFWNDAIKACDLQGNVICSPETEPTTAEPTTAEPTTAEPTTAEPTTAEPTTAEPTTAEPTTAEPTTAEPTTAEPTTAEPTTVEPTTAEPTTVEPATTTTELATTSSTTELPSTNPNGQCPDDYDPNHQVYLPHADCTKYYICTWGGVALEQNCPPNLHWNQHLSSCDFPAHAGCTSVTPTPQPTSEPATTTATTPPAPSSPTPTSTSTSAPTGDCPAVDDPNHQVYFPHPTDCSKFLTCHWGNLVELNCPSGTFWNDAVKACDLQGNVVCSLQPEPTTAEPATTATELATTTSTTVAPSTNPTPSGHCPDTYDPNHQVYLPHDDCTKYYICTWGGVALEQNCPPNLHWNQHLSYCDYPAQAGCSSASSTPHPTSAPDATTPALTTTASPAPNGDCPPVYDPNHQVYFPHADCTKYYICTYEGNKLEQNCPAGLHWSQAQSYCDRPELAQCTPLE